MVPGEGTRDVYLHYSSVHQTVARFFSWNLTRRELFMFVRPIACWLLEVNVDSSKSERDPKNLDKNLVGSNSF